MSATNPPPVYLTIEQVSELLQIPVGTLRRWRQHRDGPPALALGRHLRYIQADVIAWAENQRGARAS